MSQSRGSGVLPEIKREMTYKHKEVTHLISDEDLDRLASTQDGSSSGWFFLALGSSLSLVLPILERRDKIGNTQTPLGWTDLFIFALFVASVVGSCAFGWFWRRSSGNRVKLVTEIRQRKRA